MHTYALLRITVSMISYSNHIFLYPFIHIQYSMRIPLYTYTRIKYILYKTPLYNIPYPFIHIKYISDLPLYKSYVNPFICI